jgi:hypothetical protein
MATLDELQAVADAARDAFEAERNRLRDLEQAAVAAIREHAEVQIRVLTGAGVDQDVEDAAVVRDGAVEALQEVARRLVPARGKPVKVEPPIEREPPVRAPEPEPLPEPVEEVSPAVEP